MNGKDEPPKERKVWERKPVKKTTDGKPEKETVEIGDKDDTRIMGSQTVPPMIEPQQKPSTPQHPQTQTTPAYDYSAYYQQHPYLYAHPNTLQQMAYPQQPAAHPQAGVIPMMQVQYFPVQPLVMPPPVNPAQAGQTAEGKQTAHREEKMPERVYIQVGLVLTALSSVALFIYSMVYLYLFSREHWDPALFTGIWGFGAVYTVFAIVLGIAAATFGLIATVFLHVRAKYQMNLVMILTIALAGIIQINPAAIPLAVAAFVFVSLCQDLFLQRPDDAENGPETAIEKGNGTPKRQVKQVPKRQANPKKDKA